MELHKYIQLIKKFINENNYNTLPRDPTKQYHKIIINNINKCHVTNKQNKYKHYNTNPGAPKLRETIKIHKTH
jgi:hypothetical protein